MKIYLRRCAAALFLLIMLCSCTAKPAVTSVSLPAAAQPEASEPPASAEPRETDVPPQPEPAQPTRLTLAIVADCPVLQSFTQMLQDFNRSQAQYQIEYTVYSDTGLPDTQPAELLRTEIAAGKSPDLYAFYSDGNTAPPLTEKHVCADLLPLLGAEFAESSLVPNLYPLLTEDGCLYALPLTIEVDTLLGPASLFPRPGVTLSDLAAARQQMPEGMVPLDSWRTPQNLFALCASYCIGAYTDKDSGACNFETQGFYDYLAWCRDWGSDDSTSSASERTLIQLCWINSFGQLAGCSEAAEEYWFGEPDYTYIGFPTVDGSCGSGYRILTSLGVSPQCREPEGAKVFLAYCYSSLQGGFLPANYDLLQAEMQEYIAGNRIDDWYGEVQRVSEADAAQFYALLDSVTVLESLDAPLSELLLEEANIYFSGGCTAEQAAKNIQSRASVYLQEQYG